MVQHCLAPGKRHQPRTRRFPARRNQRIHSLSLGYFHPLLLFQILHRLLITLAVNSSFKCKSNNTRVKLWYIKEPGSCACLKCLIPGLQRQEQPRQSTRTALQLPAKGRRRKSLRGGAAFQRGTEAETQASLLALLENLARVEMFTWFVLIFLLFFFF